jgi:glycerol-3-phosphate acyltransferase PlsY
MEIAGLYLYAYLVGAVPTAYLIGRLAKGVDIRNYGSGNVGGSNVWNHVGKGWVLPLGLFEVLVKGASPIWIGEHLLALERSSALLVAAPLLAVAGHNWSVYLKLQGGRGIAVAGGTLLALAPPLLGAFILAALLGWVATRSSGFWVLISLALLPLWAVLLGDPPVITWYCGGLVVLVVAKRLLSNWTPLPADLSKKKVLLNRLFRDRDVNDRAEWVGRVPSGTK